MSPNDERRQAALAAENDLTLLGSALAAARRRSSAEPVDAPSAGAKTVAAFFVAAGILVSRVAGLVRLRAFAHYFGLQSDAADAFNAAFRIPNFLQNLFGEGALSASFIPVYASLLSRGRRQEARDSARRTPPRGEPSVTAAGSTDTLGR